MEAKISAEDKGQRSAPVRGGGQWWPEQPSHRTQGQSPRRAPSLISWHARCPLWKRRRCPAAQAMCNLISPEVRAGWGEKQRDHTQGPLPHGRGHPQFTNQRPAILCQNTGPRGLGLHSDARGCTLSLSSWTINLCDSRQVSWVLGVPLS